MTVFSAVFNAVAVSAAQDLFEIVAPSSHRVNLRAIILGQYSDAGDAQAEILSILVIRGNTVTGSGGSAVTPHALGSTSIAALSTVAANNTTPASGGSPQTLIADAFNEQGSWGYRWEASCDEEKIQLDPGTRLVIRVTAPADVITMNGTLIFEEAGLA